jgi:hypothetical protein
MSASVRAEFLKLRTRTTLALVTTMATLSVLGLLRLVHSVGSSGGIHPGTRDAVDQILGTGMAPGLLMLLVGTLSVTTELRYGSITPTLLVQPRRSQVIIAKVVTCALAGALIAVVLAVIALVVGLASGVLDGMPVAHAVRLIAGAVAGTAFWGWLGVGVGVLIRRHVPALVIPMAWLLVVETVLGSYDLNGFQRWLPGQVGGGLAGATVPGVVPAWLGLLALTAYALALTIPGTWRLVQSDIA